MRRFTLISWIMLAVGVAALLFVVYEAGAIENTATARATAAQTTSQQLDHAAYQQRIHAIAVDTQAQRAALENFAHVDVVGAAQLLERTAAAAGAHATVTDATSEGDAVALPGGGTVQWLSLSLSADGPYAALMRVEAAYEHLPFASQVTQLDLDNTTTGAEKGTWHMILKIRVLSLTNTL